MAQRSYRTDDLALATTLSLADFEYSIKKLTKAKAVWEFVIPDEKGPYLDNLLTEYAAFEAKVEPRAFVLRWGELRRELFDLIPDPNGRHRRSVAPQPAG